MHVLFFIFSPCIHSCLHYAALIDHDCVAPSGERADRPGGGTGREDQGPGELFGGAPAETGLHGGDAAAGKTQAVTRGENILSMFLLEQTCERCLHSLQVAN